MSKTKYSYSIVDVDITAGVTNLEFQTAGQRITYNKGTAEISIKLDENSNDIIYLDPKDSIPLPFGFDRFYLTAAASAQTISLIISSPVELIIDSNQVSVTSIGTVTTVTTVNTVASVTNVASVDLVDEVRQLSRDFSKRYESDTTENQFIGGDIRAAAVSNYSHIGIFNPSAVKKVAVKCITASTTLTTRLRLASYTTALLASASKINKKIGGTASVAKIETQNNASALGVDFTELHAPAGSPVSFIKRDYIILEQNKGVLVRPISQNENIAANFEWEEF